jgi:hypothetical protein
LTLIAVWKARNRLMAIADTRIARSAGNVLTEHGPKLLPITVVCNQPGDSGDFDREVYRSDVGFAYSGSTLSTLAAHALSNTLLSKLIGAPGTPPPPLSEVANFVGVASAEYMREVCQLAGQNGLFTAIVFGWCPEQQTLRAFELTPILAESPLSVNVEERILQPIALHGSADMSAIVIGTAPHTLRDAINTQLMDARNRGETNDIIAFDAPKRALRQLIFERANEMVGGTIQQAWATPAGFQIVSSLEPVIASSGARSLGAFILGFDTANIRNVGYYNIGVEGR